MIVIENLKYIGNNRDPNFQDPALFFYVSFIFPWKK